MSALIISFSRTVSKALNRKGRNVPVCCLFFHFSLPSYGSLFLCCLFGIFFFVSDFALCNQTYITYALLWWLRPAQWCFEIRRSQVILYRFATSTTRCVFALHFFLWVDAKVLCCSSMNENVNYWSLRFFKFNWKYDVFPVLFGFMLCLLVIICRNGFLNQPDFFFLFNLWSQHRMQFYSLYVLQ